MSSWQRRASLAVQIRALKESGQESADDGTDEIRRIRSSNQSTTSTLLRVQRASVSVDALCFWTTVCKTVRLWYRSVVCPVCNVGVLWPNGWTDQDETWHAGRPRLWPHCVRWGPSSPPPKGHSPQFSAHICCGQMAAWIKMSLDMKLSLGQGESVLDGDHAPPPQKGGLPRQIFGPWLLRPNSWMDAAGTWHGGRLQPRRLCVRWGPSPLHPKRGGAPCPIFGPFLLWSNGSMHQDATWYGCWPQPRGLCVGWRPSLPSSTKGAEPPPNFRPISIMPKLLDASRCHSVWR